MDGMSQLTHNTDRSPFNQKQYSKIIALLSDVVLEKHSNTDLYALLAWIYVRVGDVAKAFTYTDKAIAIDPDKSSARRQRGEALHKKGE